MTFRAPLDGRGRLPASHGFAAPTVRRRDPLTAVVVAASVVLVLVGAVALAHRTAFPYAAVFVSEPRADGVAAQPKALVVDSAEGIVWAAYDDGVWRYDARTFAHPRRAESGPRPFIEGGEVSRAVESLGVAENGGLLALFAQPDRAVAHRDSRGGWRWLLEGGRVDGLSGDVGPGFRAVAVGDQLWMLLGDGRLVN